MVSCQVKGWESRVSIIRLIARRAQFNVYRTEGFQRWYRIADG